MANKTISDLVEIAATDIDPSADVVEMDDVSAGVTKKAKVDSLAEAISAKALTVLAPSSPGAGAPINANILAGDTLLQNIQSPAGEPATADAPYYLLLDDGGGTTEHVLVLERADPTRTILAPTQNAFAAGAASVAYAGLATSPASAGLIRARLFQELATRDVLADGAKLDAIEPGADVTDAANVEAAGAVMDTDFAGAALGRLTRTGAGAYAVVKDNFTASAAPTVNDDTTAGYEVGSFWGWPGNGAWVCGDATAGNAFWVPWIATSAIAPLVAVGEGSAGANTVEAARVDHVHPARATVVTESTTARDVANADSGKVVLCDNAATITITVPDGLTVGTTVEYVQKGAGQVQVAVSGSMVLRKPATFNAYTAEQYSSLVVTIISGTEALVRGDLEAV